MTFGKTSSGGGRGGGCRRFDAGADDHVPIEELARRQDVEPIRSLDDLACPGLWDFDEEYEQFLADLYASRRSGPA
jgi:hypothetical protein